MLRRGKSRINKESKMKKLFLTISILFFIFACGGGGGYGGNSGGGGGGGYTGTGPAGDISSQLDPVQSN